ncbi:helix-turn-helix domain-containing protein [Spirillospora sp. CA-253888]
MPSRRPAPTVRLRRLAGELARLRSDSGLTREDVAERTGINPATLYRIEYAHTRPQARTLRALLELYNVEEARRSELSILLKEASQRSWLHTLASSLPEHYASYIEFETAAKSVLNYECLFVPGLLQTEEYARAAVQGTLPGATREEIQNRVDVRMRRQAVLTGDDALQLWAIVDEAALRRVVGGAQVMREQLDRLVEMAELPNVTLQVVPFGAGAHPGMPGSFVVMQFPEPMGPDLVYIESQAGDLFLEEEVDTTRYTLVFEHLRAAAAAPNGSIALISEAAEALQPGRRA